MDSSIRKPFQGVTNIIRFNWHYYALSVMLILIVFLLQYYFISFKLAGSILISIVSCSIIISLATSFYIYDLSDLYKLKWAKEVSQDSEERILNINAGFDETSTLIKRKFSHSELLVADFYDPTRHTEISIKRARKAYPPIENTQQVSTTYLPYQDQSFNRIFVVLSAHEIRNNEERVVFFKELHRVVKPRGQVLITEHLRDLPNFLAYNIGYLHFLSKVNWLSTFQLAGFTISEEIKTTPFITTFILETNGTAS
jgi:ubiquinone/menaquinone biosynthesis C-methylase UbiE